MKKKCLFLISVFVLLLNGFVFADKIKPFGIMDLYEEEPNNSFETANRIGKNRWKKASISPEDRSDDYFVFEHDGGKCTFSIFDIPMGCKFDLYIYDSDYKRIAYNIENIRVYKPVDFDYLSPGTYYMRVTSSDGYSGQYYGVGTSVY